MPRTEARRDRDVADFDALKAQTHAVGKHHCLDGTVSFSIAYNTLSALAEEMDSESMIAFATWLKKLTRERDQHEAVLKYSNAFSRIPFAVPSLSTIREDESDKQPVINIKRRKASDKESIVNTKRRKVLVPASTNQTHSKRNNIQLLGHHIS